MPQIDFCFYMLTYLLLLFISLLILCYFSSNISNKKLKKGIIIALLVSITMLFTVCYWYNIYLSLPDDAWLDQMLKMRDFNIARFQLEELNAAEKMNDLEKSIPKSKSEEIAGTLLMLVILTLGIYLYLTVE